MTNKEIGKNKLLALILIVLFICLGLAYSLMGFGRSYDIEKGQGGLYKVDRAQCVRMAAFMLDGDFGFYSRKMVKLDLVSEPGGQYNYPPVPGMLEVPVVLFARAFNLAKTDIFDIAIFPFIVLSGLAVLLLILIPEQFDCEEISYGGVTLIACFLFSGLLFYSVVEEGKFEGVVALFVLLGIYFLPKNIVLSGVSFGFALCTKQTAVLFLVPTFFVLCRQGSYRRVFVWCAVIGATALLIMAPFLIGSGPQRLYLSLSKNMDLFKIQEQTAVGFLNWALTALLGESEAMTNFLQVYSNKAILLVCVVVSLYLVIKRKIDLSKPEQYLALLAFCSFLFIVFGKFYTSGIYEVAPTYLLVLWALVARQFVFGVAVLLLQSFLCCTWPLALYRDPLLLLLYFGVVIYIWRASLVAEKGGIVTALSDYA